MDKTKLGRLSKNVEDKRQPMKQAPADSGRGAGPGPGSTDGFAVPSKMGGPGIGVFGSDGSYALRGGVTMTRSKGRVTYTERKVQPKAPTTHKFEK